MTEAEEIEAICRRHGVRRIDAIGPCRWPELVRARDEICWSLKRKRGVKLEVIAAIVGRERSSVGTAVKRHEARTAGAA